VQARRVVKRLGFNIFQTIGSQTAVRLLALHTGRHLLPAVFLVLIFIRCGKIQLPNLESNNLPAYSKVPESAMLPRPRRYQQVAEIED
jgi:hypothetical protein